MAALPSLIAGILLATVIARTLDDRSPTRRAFLGLLGAVASLAALSLGLVRVGWFGSWAVGAGLIAIAGAVRLQSRRPTAGAGIDRLSRLDRWDAATGAVLMALLILYVSHPTKYLLGGRDPGPYLAFAAHIGNSGGLNLDLPILANLVERVGDLIRLDVPAIYSAVGRGIDGDPTHRIPQFQHLWPALGAHGWLLARLEGLCRLNAALMVLALWGLREFATTRLPKPAALAVVLVVGLNPAVIWAARITMTEPLAVLLGFGALVVLDAARARGSSRGHALAGVVLGLGAFNRLDGVLGVLLVLAFAVATIGLDRGARRGARWLAMAYAGVATLGLLDGWVHSAPYLSDLWNLGQLDKLVILHGVGSGLAIATTFVGDRGALPKSLVSLAFAAGVVFLAAWFSYAWWGGDPAADAFEDRALRELAWYVTPAAFPLAILGAWVCIRDTPDLRTWGPVVGLTVATAFIFTWRPSITPDHIWASRRWLPHVIPGLGLLGTAGVVWLWSTLRAGNRTVAWACALAPLVYSVANSVQFARPFIFRTMFEGIERNYEHLAHDLRREGVALSDNHHVASILTYVYGVPTVLVTRPRDAWRRAEAEALAGIPFIGLHPRPNWTTLHTRLRVGGPFLERTWKRPPTTVKHRPYGAHLGVIDPDYASGDKAFEFVASDLGVGIGEYDHESRRLRSTGGEGSLQYGPYVRVPAGSYRVVWYGTVEKGGRIDVDVVSAAGKSKHAFQELDVAPQTDLDVIAGLSFQLTKAAPKTEFRLFIRGAQVSIERIEVHRTD